MVECTHEFRPIDSSGQLACIHCNARYRQALVPSNLVTQIRDCLEWRDGPMAPDRRVQVIAGRGDYFWNALRLLFASVDETSARRRDWVNCPICSEPDMLKEFDADGRGLIHCTNRICRSNSETSGERDEMLREIRAAHHLNTPNTAPCQCRWCSRVKTSTEAPL